MKGYKVFNNDWTCRGFQYEVGKQYKHDGEISVCNSGFHFCEKAVDCFSYYSFDPKNKVAEVEATGNILTYGDKSVTNGLKIVREIEWAELLEMVNTGQGNTGHCNSGNWNSGERNSGNWNSGERNGGNRNSGHCNSGDRNSGHRNSGDCNSGDWNSGDWNSGHCNSGNWNSGERNSGNWNSGNRNSGHCNSGDRNSGDWNSGHRNSGDRNSGDRNSGDWNISNFNSGCFNTKENTIKLFDMDSDWTMRDWLNSKQRSLMSRIKYALAWVDKCNMTETEKQEYPTHKTTGGYLKKLDQKELNVKWWNELTDSEKETIKAIPNFDADKFELIMGIKIEPNTNKGEMK